MSGAGDELVDHLDERGVVVGAVSRAEMRARNLWHRTVFVVVVDRRGRVLVHQRAPWKDVWPGRWDLAFGGVVGAGEPWLAAARRELAEEAGITGRLRRLGQASYQDASYQDASVRERCRVYLTCSDGPFTFADGEVVDSARVAPGDLEAWLAATEVVPDSEAVVVPLLVAGSRVGR